MRRRTYLAGGGTAIATLLAGCVGSADEETSGTESDPETAEPTESEDAESYTVSMEPMGAVTFEEPPERWVALLPSYADMGIALGVEQSLGIQHPNRYASHFYEEIPGIDYDPDAVTTLAQDGVDKEVFYELDADVHFMEPNQLIHWYDWDRDDVEEIAATVGPFLGNFIRRRSDDWHDYPYYSLYGAFEKVAEVFRRTDRFEAFASFHDEFVADVQARLPDERPRALLVYPAQEPPREFYPYPIHEGGVGKKQWRDLQLRDALNGTDLDPYAGGGGSGSVDMETLLEIDPEVLIVRGQKGKSRTEFEESVVEHLEADDVAGEVTAIANGDVYRGGYLDQGPILNLFQTELAAQRLYPDVFDEDELFDRQRVADIVHGDF